MKGLAAELRKLLPGATVDPGGGGMLWVSLRRDHGGAEEWLAWLRLVEVEPARFELKLRPTPRARKIRAYHRKTWHQVVRMIQTAVRAHLWHELNAAQVRVSLIRKALQLAGPGTTPDATVQQRAGSGAGKTFDATLREQVERLGIGACPRCGDVYGHRKGCPSYFAGLGEHDKPSTPWRP